VTYAGDDGNAGSKQRWLVIYGIELSFALHFQENVWTDLYKIAQGEHFDTVLKSAPFNLHSFARLMIELINIFRVYC
jgi:hypothetical protein